MRYRDALKRAGDFGVIEDKRRGTGSERLWIRETEPGSRKGPRATVKCHNEGMEMATGTLLATLRRLGIDKDDFFD